MKNNIIISDNYQIQAGGCKEWPVLNFSCFLSILKICYGRSQSIISLIIWYLDYLYLGLSDIVGLPLAKPITYIVSLFSYGSKIYDTMTHDGMPFESGLLVDNQLFHGECF